jgi:hypothetical protein
MQLIGLIHGQIADHYPWDCLVWKALICGSDAFFDHPIVPLCFRHMILSIHKVHLHIQVVLDLIHHTAVFTITVYFSYHKSGIIVVPEDFVKHTKVFFVLSGFDGNQTLVLDHLINCGQHTAFIHVHAVIQPCTARCHDVS